MQLKYLVQFLDMVGAQSLAALTWKTSPALEEPLVMGKTIQDVEPRRDWVAGYMQKCESSS